MAPSPESALPTPPAARSGCESAPAARRTASSGVEARSASASATSAAEVGSGRGNQAGGGSGGGGGSGSRSKSTVAMSTPETPSTRQWWVLEITAKAPPLDPLDEPQLPQRLGPVEPLRQHPAGQVAQ